MPQQLENVTSIKINQRQFWHKNTHICGSIPGALIWSHPISVFVNRALCVYSPMYMYHPCCYVLSICDTDRACLRVLILPSRSLSLSGRARGPVSDQSPLRRKRFTGGCLSCGNTHQRAVNHSQNFSDALKITLSTPSLDFTLESFRLARLQEFWPTNIYMRGDLIMVKEGLAALPYKVQQNNLMD